MTKDRVRFISRLDEEGARVFAHVNASVGYLEVTPLQVRNINIHVLKFVEACVFVFVLPQIGLD